MITVSRHPDGRYAARITPPHGDVEPWASPGPLPLRELIDALRERGCHQQDIGDALYAVDPDWVSHLGPPR
jgi:hypothetical protein